MERRFWILLPFLASSVLNPQIQGYEIAVSYLYKWNLPFDISANCSKFHMIESDGTVLRICSEPEDGDSEQLHSSKTNIRTVDERDVTISCTIPNFSAIEVVALDNLKIVMQDDGKILIIDKEDCTIKTVQTKGNGIMPQESSFILINHTTRNENEFFEKGFFTAKQYNTEGNLIAEFYNISQQRGELVYQGQFIDEFSEKPKYFLIQNILKNSNRWGVVDIFDHAFRERESKSIRPYPKSYSSAHNNFSICYEENGLKCQLYDDNFQPLYTVTVTSADPTTSDNYKFVSVHNLLGGGLIVMFCERMTDDTCRLFYAIIDEHGRLFGHRYWSIESLYADGSYEKPILLGYNTTFMPEIFEIYGKRGIYCLAFPQENSSSGLVIRVKTL